MVQPWFKKLNSHLPSALRYFSKDLILIESVGVLLLISWFSWVFIEVNALQLKKYFRLERPVAAPPKKMEQLSVTYK